MDRAISFSMNTKTGKASASIYLDFRTLASKNYRLLFQIKTGCLPDCPEVRLNATQLELLNQHRVASSSFALHVGLCTHRRTELSCIVLPVPLGDTSTLLI